MAASRLIILSVITALSAVCAAQLGDDIDRYGPNNGHGPRRLNLTDFNQALDHPNASTSFPLSGPDLGGAYPALAGTEQPWSLSIDVTADVPTANSTSSDIDKTKFFTGTRVRLNVPPALVSLAADINADPSSHNGSANNSINASGYNRWRVCIMTWTFAGYPYPNLDVNKLSKDDGSCTSIVSGQCVRDMENATVARYNYPYCSCPVASEIPSCGTDSLFHEVNCMARWYNVSDVAAWTGGHVDAVEYGGAMHDKGNVTAYDETGSLGWPVMVLWGGFATGRPRDAAHPGNGPDENTTAKLTCVRAMNATPGSTVPSSAGTRGFGLGTVWLSLGLALAMMWL